MGDISKNSQFSKTYTVHCLRAVAIQGMNDAGLEIRHILHMSRHLNESSVRTYNRNCSTAQKKVDGRYSCRLTVQNRVDFRLV